MYKASQTVDRIVSTIQDLQKPFFFALYSLLSTLYSLLSTLYSLLSTLYSLLSTLYSLLSTLYFSRL